MNILIPFDAKDYGRHVGLLSCIFQEIMEGNAADAEDIVSNYFDNEEYPDDPDKHPEDIWGLLEHLVEEDYAALSELYHTYVKPHISNEDVLSSVSKHGTSILVRLIKSPDLSVEWVDRDNTVTGFFNRWVEEGMKSGMISDMSVTRGCPSDNSVLTEVNTTQIIEAIQSQVEKVLKQSRYDEAVAMSLTGAPIIRSLQARGRSWEVEVELPGSLRHLLIPD